MQFFHPLINAWFSESYGEATAVQAQAWPLIAAGKTVLAIAPTGSGKTLTAFLGAISRFVQGDPAPAEYRPDELSVLYVSPLKALNEDIRRNLLEPIAALKARFEAAGRPFPDIRVETRSGDTPSSQRRRFAVHPPSILATTPESLAVLLLSDSGRAALRTVKLVIIDEIHSALGSKRGAYMACQIDRLALLVGERFQRIGLSATVNPAEAAAEFLSAHGEEVCVVNPPLEKRIELTIEMQPRPHPATPTSGGGDVRRYAALVELVLERLKIRRTVLVFTGSRRRAERIASLLNEAKAKDADGSAILAFVHHGSLSLELRRAVEKGLAAGVLRCVVATGSLELGIDIGAVDEVILAGSPSSAASAAQRIGRAGHGVGQTSRATLFPFNGLDVLQAAAVAAAVREREIEKSALMHNPLDVLTQVILSLCVTQAWNEDDLFATLRTFTVFQTLEREAFDTVTAMLQGLSTKGGERLRELKPLLYKDEGSGVLTASPGARGLLYLNGGMIASRGYYTMRLADGTRIGELDEEFVWERRLGDHFQFGGRTWVINSISPEAVTVQPRQTQSDYSPFWRAEAANRSPLLTRRILEILNGETEGQSEDMLNEFLNRQRKVQGSLPLPSQRFFPIEVINDPFHQQNFKQVILHTFRGGALNYPLALALAQYLEEASASRVEAQADDNGVILTLPGGEAAVGLALKTLAVNPGLAERCFKQRLASSGVFGAAFREAAERSLLLPRAGFNRRTPLWMIRRRSKELYDRVSGLEGFPVTLEAWRTCLQEAFDIPGFRAFFDDIASGALTFAFFETRHPSPFAENLVWQNTNTLLYEYDARPELRKSGLGDTAISDAVIAEVLNDTQRLPALSAEIVADFCAKLRRELPGWGPQDETGLAEWVKERIAIPRPEWEALSKALPADLQQQIAADPSLKGRLVWTAPDVGTASCVHRDRLQAWKEAPLSMLEQWLRYEGPLSLVSIAAVFGVTVAALSESISANPHNAWVVYPHRSSLCELPSPTSGGGVMICDRGNLELLLRVQRKGRRRTISEKPASVLLPFLARRQGLLNGESGPDFTFPPSLSGYALPPGLWESDVLPARFPAYKPALLDREIEAVELLWFGAGKERIAFSAPEDLSLASGPDMMQEPFNGAIPDDFFDMPRDFWDIKERLGLDTAAAAASLWKAVWEGRLSADSFAPLRKALAEGYIPKDLSAVKEMVSLPLARPLPRALQSALRQRWRGGPPVSGRWFSLSGGAQANDDQTDLLDEESLKRQRVALLIRRWGILARPLLERELPPLSWSALLPTIRRMELAGEVIAGRFISGLDSLQFAPPEAIEALEEATDEKGMYWMNATDPACQAGFSIDLERLPARIASSRICCRGTQVLAVSNKQGRELRIFIPPFDPELGAALAAITTGLEQRPGKRAGKALIESVNGVPASHSPYTEALQSIGFLPDRSSLVRWNH